MPNAYSLIFPRHLQVDALSVLEFTLLEALNQPYQLDIALTCPNPQLDLARLIHQPVAFRLQPSATLPGAEAAARQWSGVVREARRGRVSADETRYHFHIAPRLTLLQDHFGNRLYQRTTVPAMVEDMLREFAGLTGADFEFRLTRDYPVHEHRTVYQEDMLGALQRLCADEGIAFAFAPQQPGDSAEKLLFFDNLEGYERDSLRHGLYREQAGLEAAGEMAVSALSVSHQGMSRSTRLRDHNLYDAPNRLDVDAGFQGETPAAHGARYFYGEHYRQREDGEQLARLRQEFSVSRQCQAEGAGNLIASRPGAVLRLDRAFAEAPHGWLITEARHQGSRREAYRNQFQAIPADRVWRPQPLPWPVASGQQTATVVSPGDGHYLYPYLSEHGHYVVRFDWDTRLNTRPGTDTRWVRLARPYAGGQYGMHFGLHAGVRVLIGFLNGNIDEPYICGAVSDSQHPDLLTSDNHSRNIIRTWGKNKLRMEDLRGKEHIKLATEYGKTQLNLGHLVDSGRQGRGEGFEVRTDHWGALRAGKGLLLSAHAQPGAGGAQRDMDAAIQHLEAANRLSDSLGQAAAQAQAEPVNLQAQVDLLKQQLADLQQAVLLASAPAGIALSAGDSLHAAAGQDISLTAQQRVNVSAKRSFIANVGEAISLFAAKAGLKLYANQGKVDIQAQGDELLLSSQKDTQIRSLKKISLAAQEEIVLTVGGNALRITADGVSTYGKTTVYGPLSVTGLSGSPRDLAALPGPVGLFNQQFRLRNPQGFEWKGLPLTINTPAGNWVQASDKQGGSHALHDNEQAEVEAELLWMTWEEPPNDLAESAEPADTTENAPQ